MSDAAEFRIDKICPVCGKTFGVLDSDIWAYKWRPDKSHMRYYCSWKCLRADEAKRERRRPVMVETEHVPDRKKPKNSEDLILGVIEEVREGRSGADWLERQGYDHYKKWHVLKKWAERNNPKLLEQMPKSLARKPRAG